MSLPPLPPPPRSLQILKTILYVLAGIVLVLGLVGGISLMAGAGRTVQNILQPLALFGGGAAFNLVAPMLSAFLINLGVGVLILALIFSGLLYAAGRLAGHAGLLEARLARLEARS